MRVRVSRLVAFWWRDGQLICDDPVRHRQLALTPEAERRLRSYARWADLADGDALARRLLDAGVLIAEGSPEHALEERLGAWRAMGPAATHYHLASRTQAGDSFRTAVEDAAVLRAKAVRTPQPSPVKEYAGPRVPLPDGELPAEPFGAVLEGRRSTRWFDAERPMSVVDFATLLRWTAGVRHEVDVPGLGPTLLKTTPSGGARHPIEVYPVVRAVDGLAPGVYHYASREHALSRLTAAPVDADTLQAWCGGQPHASSAACLLLYTAVPERTTWKYASSRAYRALLLDLGHLSQTVYLVAAALRLGVFFTAATRDAMVEEALGLSWTDEVFLGVTGVGVPHPAERDRQRAMRSGAGAGFSFPPDAWHGYGE
ncbi:SagB family peptide dehydrogenase [Phytohabitans sp. LJ34]|uniref:SagB family peptide dehydrogenase n=1 Tax=Phytohabitans sp. LJ34 TaxID=3452217 RepID=UPI003F88634A